MTYHDTLKGRQNSFLGFLRKRGAFEDVKAKGKRIFDDDLYDIWQMNTYSVLIDVLGDNDVYTVYINDKARVNKYESNTPMMWQCTCTWADWAFNRETYHGRICSHVYCAYLLLREVKKMAKVSSENFEPIDEPEIENVFEGEEFESTENELVFNIVYDYVSNDYEAFYDYVVNGYATYNVTDAIVDIVNDYDIDFEDIVEVIKLCLMQFTENDVPTDRIEELELAVHQEELENVDTTDFTNRDDELDELLESELFDEIDPEEEKTSRRRMSNVKRAGRFFTEEEKLALIDEDGVSWHVLNGMFR